MQLIHPHANILPVSPAISGGLAVKGVVAGGGGGGRGGGGGVLRGAVDGVQARPVSAVHLNSDHM